jgi:hypothetical protein
MKNSHAMKICIIVTLWCFFGCVPVTITLPDKTNTNTLQDEPKGISLWVDGRACIDERKINTYGGCARIAEPVCGCDGYSYSNSCDARNHGVLFFLDKEMYSE